MEKYSRRGDESPVLRYARTKCGQGDSVKLWNPRETKLRHTHASSAAQQNKSSSRHGRHHNQQRGDKLWQMPSVVRREERRAHITTARHGIKVHLNMSPLDTRGLTYWAGKIANPTVGANLIKCQRKQCQQPLYSVLFLLVFGTPPPRPPPACTMWP